MPSLTPSEVPSNVPSLTPTKVPTSEAPSNSPTQELFEGNRRTLIASDIVSSDCCKEDYELLMAGIGQHLVVAALSECIGSNEICKCPSTLVFHLDTYFDENTTISVKKEILEVSEDDLAKHDRLSVGSFSLEKIIESFNKAMSEEKVYDLVSHNCGSLLIEMFLELGIDPTDKSIVTYAANHLFDNANSFMIGGLSENEFRLALEGNSNLQDDEYTIIEDFVSKYIRERV
jgi:hypothetical protein